MQSYTDVKRQIALLERKAAELRKNALARIIATIKGQIAEYDLSAEDLGFAGNGKAAAKPKVFAKRRPKTPPKYADPKTGKTWNGIGKPPAWIAGAIKKGRRDDFLIDRATAKAAVAKAAKPAAKKAAAKPAAGKAPAGKKPAAPAKTPTVAVAKVAAKKAVGKPKAASKQKAVGKPNAAKKAVKKTPLAPATAPVVAAPAATAAGA